jgi:hypothetical protein
VAPILDLAVVVLAVMVCVSLGLLAWTLGVSITRVLRRTRENLVNTRLELTVAERRLREAGQALAEAREAGLVRAAEPGATEQRLTEGDR